MPNDLQSLFDRHIGTFMDQLTAENYKPETIKAYRVLLKRLVSLIEAAGISPQDLTAERAAELVRNDERNRREPKGVPEYRAALRRPSYHQRHGASSGRDTGADRACSVAHRL